MDSALNVAAAISGLLSLTIQITQVTHHHTSNITNLPRLVSCYVEELVCLKRVLVDVQDALLFGPELIDIDGMQLLHFRIEKFDTEMSQLCERLQAAQRPAASQLLKRLFWPLQDEETLHWTESITQCRRHIQELVVISGLRIQLQTLQEVRMGKYRQEVLEREILRTEILDWICDSSMQKKHSELLSSHHPGTGQWVFERAEFKEWLAGDKATLWCHGNPGVGKTQTMSLIAEQLSRDYRVAYFYCNHQESGSQTEAVIVSSLLRQIVEQELALPPALEELHKRLGHGRGALGFDDATRLMINLCASTQKRICILLDALDECNPSPRRRKILSLLDQLSSAGAKVVVASRPHVAIAKQLLTSFVRLEVESNISDIRAYTEHMINQSDELSELLGENMRDEAVQRVVEQANKMFLLAVFQCLHLSRLTRRREVRKALKSLPRGLDMAYEQSMLRINRESTERRSLALAALSWIYHAEQPLRISELLQALAIDPAARQLSDEDSVSGNLVLDVCAGLVVFDSQRDACRFAHYSVYEYFHQESTYQRWFPSAKRDIANANLAFLTLENMSCIENDARGGVDAILRLYPFMKYAAQFWGQHMRDGYHEGLDGKVYEFLADKPRVELVVRILDGASKQGMGAPMYPSANLGVLLAARFGALGALELLVRRGHSLVGRDASGRTALHWAARGGFHQALGMILQEVDIDASTPDGRTALHWAAKHGHLQVVVELLRSGADPTIPTIDGRTALHWAASRGHKSVVKVLLADNRVDASYGSGNAWTALHWAACSGDPVVVLRGVDPQEEAHESNAADNSPSTEGRPCMGGEEVRRYEDTMVLLLEAGVSPDLPTKRGRTAVHWAAASGQTSIIQLLKGRGAVLSAADVNGKHPWHFAVERGARAAMALLCPAA